MAKGVWQKGGVCGKGGHTWQRGVCVVRGHVWWGGMHGIGVCMAGNMHGRGTYVVGVCGGGASMAGETATAVDGTHPTGMHSCLDE